MARYSAAARTTAGSATLPIMSLYNSATVNAAIVEVQIFNTTAVAVSLKLIRVSTTGTQGAALTEVSHEAVAATASCQAFNTHSVAPTLVTGDIMVATLGAAIGSGVIWTFGAHGLVTGLAGTGVGVAILPVGTGQACDCTIVWDE